jgi:hypothetical protein
VEEKGVDARKILMWILNDGLKNDKVKVKFALE